MINIKAKEKSDALFTNLSFYQETSNIFYHFPLTFSNHFPAYIFYPSPSPCRMCSRLERDTVAAEAARRGTNTRPVATARPSAASSSVSRLCRRKHCTATSRTTPLPLNHRRRSFQIVVVATKRSCKRTSAHPALRIDPLLRPGLAGRLHTLLLLDERHERAPLATATITEPPGAHLQSGAARARALGPPAPPGGFAQRVVGRERSHVLGFLLLAAETRRARSSAGFRAKLIGRGRCARAKRTPRRSPGTPGRAFNSNYTWRVLTSTPQ